MALQGGSHVNLCKQRQQKKVQDFASTFLDSKNSTERPRERRKRLARRGNDAALAKVVPLQAASRSFFLFFFLSFSLSLFLPSSLPSLLFSFLPPSSFPPSFLPSFLDSFFPSSLHFLPPSFNFIDFLFLPSSFPFFHSVVRSSMFIFTYRSTNRSFPFSSKRTV